MLDGLARGPLYGIISARRLLRTWPEGERSRVPRRWETWKVTVKVNSN
jgi:hypothetical protein